MDKRSYKRVVLFAGLLFLTFAGGIAAAWGWINTVRTEDMERLGQCILLEPETAGEYVSIFEGKEKVDSRRAARAGLEALEEYGYTGEFRGFPRSLAGFLPVLAAMFLFVAFLLGFALFYKQKQRKKMQLQIFAMEDRITQLSEENKIVRERMKQEEARTKALVTDISHQLKTPLASLKMCYEIADTGSFSEEEQRSFLMQGAHEVGKLENLVKSLVQLSRLETNMIRIEGKMESLKKTIRSAVNSVYMKAFDKNISISVNDFEDERIFHDPKWTQEALVNVLDNAVKYSEPGTAVDIRVSPTLSYYLVEIEDQGMGIPNEEMNQVFKRFYRGQNEKVQQTEGSGVGLYLTRKILEEQGGTIRIKKGTRGSIFQITIPKTQVRKQRQEL